MDKVTGQRRKKTVLLTALTALAGMGVAGAIVTGPDEEVQAADKQQALLVWSQATDNEYPVYFSKLDGETWSEPVKLSQNKNMNVVPSVTTDQEGHIWVVWSSFDGKNLHLYYKKSDGGSGWSEETKLETGFSSNTAPSIAVDQEGTLWLAWAAFDGQDDEIVSARWNGYAFEPPVRVTDNQVPDVLPVLSVASEGTLSVQWQGYSGGQYRTFSSSYRDDTWSEASSTSGQENAAATAAAGDTAEESAPEATVVDLELPQELATLPSLSLHVSGMTIQSIPARLLQIENN